MMMVVVVLHVIGGDGGSDDNDGYDVGGGDGGVDNQQDECDIINLNCFQFFLKELVFPGFLSHFIFLQ